jgi:hypothetical protein
MADPNRSKRDSSELPRGREVDRDNEASRLAVLLCNDDRSTPENTGSLAKTF